MNRRENLTGRRLLAVIEAGEIVHGSPFRFSISFDPAAPVRWFPASAPIADLVANLNEVQPTQINSFASSLQEIGAEALGGATEDPSAPGDREFRTADAGDPRCGTEGLGFGNQQYVGLRRGWPYWYRVRRA